MRLFRSLSFSILLAALVFSLATPACRKIFNTEPTTRLTPDDLTGSEGPQTILNGVYRYMRTTFEGAHDAFGVPATLIVADLMGDDMSMLARNWFYDYYNYNNSTTLVTYFNPRFLWTFYYRIIDNLNQVLSTGGVAEAQRGQALALRAYCYYNLMGFFTAKSYKSDSTSLAVPLYLENTQTGREPSSVQAVYQQILDDLNASISAFRSAPFTRTQKSQVDSFVAHGLLARTYLTMERFTNAETEAYLALGKTKNGSSLDGSDLMDSATYQAGFSNIDNIEWIWGLPTNATQTTIYASFYSHMDPTIGGYAGIGAPKYMSKNLYDSMKDGDVRKSLVLPLQSGNGTTMFSLDTFTRNLFLVSAKFRDPNSSFVAVEALKQGRQLGLVSPSWTGAVPLMRKAEMYLIVAECQVSNGSSSSSSGSTNGPLASLKTKRGSHNGSGNGAKDSVYVERRRELWGEGFRIFDIKRLGIPVDRRHLPDSVGVLGAPSVVSAGSDSLKYVIPQTERDNNTNFRF